MKIQRFLRVTYSSIFVFVTLFVVGLVNQAYSQNNAITMKYSQKAGMTNKYTITSKGNTEMDLTNIMGQVSYSTESSNGEMIHKIAGFSDGVLNHELLISKLSISHESDMQGSLIFDATKTLNKTLNVTTDIHGRDLQILNIKDIPAIPDNPVPVILTTLDILPDLATEPVKVNDIWKVEHDRTIDANEGLLNIKQKIEYKFISLEEKLGFECMKIVGNITGRITGSSVMQGQPVDYSGDFQNTVTFYFAHDDGFLVEVVTENTMTMNLNMADFSIPMKQTGLTTISFVK